MSRMGEGGQRLKRGMEGNVRQDFERAEVRGRTVRGMWKMWGR